MPVKIFDPISVHADGQPELEEEPEEELEEPEEEEEEVVLVEVVEVLVHEWFRHACPGLQSKLEQQFPE